MVDVMPALPSILLLLAATADLRACRLWAHVARGTAMAAALASAWVVYTNGALTLHLYRWMQEEDLLLDAGFYCDGVRAALLVAVVFWVVVAPLVTSKSEGRSTTALDLAGAGAAVAVVAEGHLLRLGGAEMLLVVSFLYVARRAPTETARRLLFSTRLAGLLVVATLVLAATTAAAWVALLAALVLVGSWPFHTWLQDVGEGDAATGIRLASVATGVALLLSHAERLPTLALPALAVAAIVAVVGALATQELFRARMLVSSAQGSLVLAAAIVDPVAALLLFAVCGATQVTHAVGLGRIAAALPTVLQRFPDLGGLRTVLPGVFRTALAATLLAGLSPTSLWAHARMAEWGMTQAGQAGAAFVAVLFALPILPLARLSLMPFSGAVRHTTVSSQPEPVVPRWMNVVVLLFVAGPPAAIAWSVSGQPVSMPVIFSAGAAALLCAIGPLLWRREPRNVTPADSSLRLLFADGLGISWVLSVTAIAIEASARFVWTAIDGVLLGGIPFLLNLATRMSGWLLARLHDGWSGWAVAVALGIASILLWSMQAGRGTW
jgi:hypothetical protein